MRLAVIILLTSSIAFAADVKLPDGYWPLEQSQPIVDRTQTIRLAPDLSTLTPGEATAVKKLLEVGQIFQRLYEEQRHHQVAFATRELEQLDRRRGSPRETQNLLMLRRLFQGPIATTLDNRREPFLPVSPTVPGKNVYHWGLTEKELEAHLAANPADREDILHLRSVVLRRTESTLKRGLVATHRYPVLDTLHPGVRDRLLKDAQGTPRGQIFALPYSVAYADELINAFKLLFEAADAVENDDEDFAQYLRNRARDLLSNDYESGDASWVTGDFKRLNAQLGSYEVYDDELAGVKTFFSASILLRNEEESGELRRAIHGLQEFENSLPYEQHKKVREDIPVGVYDVIADFGQARGANTATILPNESYIARKYGRTILLRANIMRHPDLFARSGGVWRSAVTTEFENDLAPEGNFYRTLWHEIGHYLGVDRDRGGRDLDQSLQENSSLLEEMKADLVSLFLGRELHKRGYYTDQQLRAVYASGILRVLQNVQPRRDQPYQAMQVMQMNYFLENGLLQFDQKSKELRINYDRYHDVVGGLLKEVLRVQHEGDKAAADKFIERWFTWRNDLHGALAEKIRAQQKYRFTLVRYAALGE